MKLVEVGLVIERVDVAHRAGAVDHEYPLRLRIEVSGARRVGIIRVDTRADRKLPAEGSGILIVCRQQLSQPEATKRPCCVLQKVTPGEETV